MISGEIAPGEIELAPFVDETARLSELIRLAPHVGGEYLDAPTWWDGHFSAEYYYRAHPGELQQLIHQLTQFPEATCRIEIVPEEGFREGNLLVHRERYLSYDWSLQISQTRIRDFSKYPREIPTSFNKPVVVLKIYDSEFLDRTDLWLPYRLLTPTVIEAPESTRPASALEALSRADRRR